MWRSHSPVAKDGTVWCLVQGHDTPSGKERAACFHPAPEKDCVSSSLNSSHARLPWLAASNCWRALGQVRYRDVRIRRNMERRSRASVARTINVSLAILSGRISGAPRRRRRRRRRGSGIRFPGPGVRVPGCNSRSRTLSAWSSSPAAARGGGSGVVQALGCEEPRSGATSAISASRAGCGRVGQRAGDRIRAASTLSVRERAAVARVHRAQPPARLPQRQPRRAVPPLASAGRPSPTEQLSGTRLTSNPLWGRCQRGDSDFHANWCFGLSLRSNPNGVQFLDCASLPRAVCVFPDQTRRHSARTSFLHRMPACASQSVRRFSRNRRKTLIPYDVKFAKISTPLTGTFTRLLNFQLSR